MSTAYCRPFVAQRPRGINPGGAARREWRTRFPTPRSTTPFHQENSRTATRSLAPTIAPPVSMRLRTRGQRRPRCRDRQSSTRRRCAKRARGPLRVRCEFRIRWFVAKRCTGRCCRVRRLPEREPSLRRPREIHAARCSCCPSRFVGEPRVQILDSWRSERLQR